MAGRKELFALAVIVSGLALSGLARVPRMRAAEPAAAARVQGRPRAAISGGALRALRDARPLDVNTAAAGDLELLPGVGPALAQRIVAHRAEHGAFTSVDALSQVRGIGPKTLARLRPLITVGSAAPAKGSDAPSGTAVPTGRTPAAATR